MSCTNARDRRHELEAHSAPRAEGRRVAGCDEASRRWAGAAWLLCVTGAIGACQGTAVEPPEAVRQSQRQEDAVLEGALMRYELDGDVVQIITTAGGAEGLVEVQGQLAAHFQVHSDGPTASTTLTFGVPHSTTHVE